MVDVLSAHPCWQRQLMTSLGKVHSGNSKEGRHRVPSSMGSACFGLVPSLFLCNRFISASREPKRASLRDNRFTHLFKKKTLEAACKSVETFWQVLGAVLLSSFQNELL